MASLKGNQKGITTRQGRLLRVCVFFPVTKNTTYSSNSNMIMSHHALSRYHAGALWLEALRSGEKNLHKKSKSQLQNQAGGLTSRELDNIAAFIASASDLQENT